jgi:hypothetical protein
MPIETVEASAWRHLDVARDAIDMARARRIHALAPGESISFIDGPPCPPWRTQAVAGLTDMAKPLTDTTAITVPAVDADTGPVLTGVLDLSATTNGDGGAAALLAANDATATEEGTAAAADVDGGDLANRWHRFQTVSSSYQNTVSFLDEWRSQWRVGRPWEIDMNGMKEYTAEWDKAHIGALEPQIDDYFTPEDLELLFSDSSLFGGNASAETHAAESSGGETVDGGAAEVGYDRTAHEDGDRSGEGVIYGPEERSWEAEWDARMRSYDDQYNALSTFRGSVSQGYLDYANEMTLAFLQPPTWEDSTVEVGLEDGFDLSDPWAERASADEDFGADDAGADIDFSGLIEQTLGSTNGDVGQTLIADTGSGDTDDRDISGEGSRGDKGATETETADGHHDGTAGDTAQRVVVIGQNLPRDSLGNGLEIDSQGNAFVHLANGGGTIVLGTLAPDLVQELSGSGAFAGSFLARLANSSGVAMDDVLRWGARTTLPTLAEFGSRALAALPALTAGQLGLIAVGMVLPGNMINDGTQSVPMGDNQRFVIRPGDLYGRVQERSADGNWSAGYEARAYDTGGQVAILTDEQIARLRDPMINVPVNPGPSATPGSVADDRDTSTPVLQPPDLLPPLTTTTPRSEPSWADLIVNAKRFENQLPDNLPRELESAVSVGVRPIEATDLKFEHLVNQGTIKFVLLESGVLIVAPHTVDGIEISHAVLSGGRAVIAAGEADIAYAGGVFFGTEITPHSGHYLNGSSTVDSDASLELAKKAFEELGITFH